MNTDILEDLMSTASNLALANDWSENAYEVNMKILEFDNNNSAAYTRLAKYYRMKNNLEDAKKMYIKALEINPDNTGAQNNLNEVQREQKDKEFIDSMNTGRDLFIAGRSLSVQRKYTLSLKCLEKAYSLEPLLKYAVTAGKIYKKLGKYDEVKNLYNHLLKTNSSISDIEAEFKPLLHR